MLPDTYPGDLVVRMRNVMLASYLLFERFLSTKLYAPVTFDKWPGRFVFAKTTHFSVIRTGLAFVLKGLCQLAGMRNRVQLRLICI